LLYGDRMKKTVIFALCIVILLTACTSSVPAECEIFAMDTFMTVRIWGETERLNEVTQLIRTLDATLSAELETSDIYAINQNKNGIVSDLTIELINKALYYSAETDGAFDPTIYPLVCQWRSAADTPPTPNLEPIGYQNISISGDEITLKSESALDFGGIGKGFAAQKSVELLKESEVEAAILSLGGNVQTLGAKPDGSKWAIGIADPSAPNEHIAVVEFEGSMALVTSGSYQRYYEIGGEKYHHILNPKTGYPAENELASVTILTQNGTMADAFSTALFVMGLEKASEFWRSRNDFDAVFILKDGSIMATDGAALLLKECEFTVIER